MVFCSLIFMAQSHLANFRWSGVVQGTSWLVAGLLCSVVSLAGSEPPALHNLSLRKIEERVTQIDSELDQLANLTLRGGVGNLGWSSRLYQGSQNSEWIEIDLGEERLVDQIVLVPVIWRDAQFGIRANAFPRSFEILVGQAGDAIGKVVASFGADEGMTPRIAPLVVAIEPVTASWVRVRATSLSANIENDYYSFQLSEVMVFEGEENWALNRPVTASSTANSRVRDAISASSLVDGFTPYVIDTGQGGASQACVIFYRKEELISLEIDLGESLPLDQLHLHAADVSESVPKVQYADYALPKRFLLEGANEADFSDARVLTEYERNSIYQAGPINMVRFAESRCRYVRLWVLDGYKSPEAGDNWRCFGFAEVELFSRGRNVSLGKPMNIIANESLLERVVEGELATMTDGRNHFGNILPIRAWVDQLGRRQELEAARPLVEGALQWRYGRQKSLLKLMQGAAILLAAGIILTILVDRIFRMRQVARIKKRFGADLHDEVGANLHAIALLSDMIQQKVEDPEVAAMVKDVRTISLETTDATQHCTSMLEAKGICENLAGELRRVAERMLVGLEHELEIEGEENLQLLSPKRRIDLLLFYKECLANIVRHSQATKVTTDITASLKAIELVVSDDGISFTGEFPPSLKRRARLIRAKVQIDRPEGEGTSVALKMRTGRFGF